MCKSHLVFIQLTIFVFLLSFILKCDNNETHEYVNHKEGNDNNIDNVVSGNNWSVVVDWSMVF